MRCRHSPVPTLDNTRQVKAARKGAMCVGSFRLLCGAGFGSKTATEIGSRVCGRLPSFVRCRGRIEVCGIRIPAQAANLPPDACGGSPRAEVRLRALCRIGHHAGVRPYQRRVHRMRIGPRTRGLAMSASEQTIGWHFDHVERGLLWRFVRIRFARAKGCSLLRPWSR